jgi:glycyl-tRNA synthetase beta chain
MTDTTPQDLLVEIGTEELPPTALRGLSDALHQGLIARLDEHRLSHGDSEAFCAPRRLAVLIHDLSRRQPDQETMRRGPAVTAAFDADGNPTKAALGFARSCGVEVADLDREETPKGAWLAFRKVEQGRDAAALLPSLVEQALGALPIPKRMRWGSGDAEFVRPVHWVCMLFGDQRVPGQVLGIETGTSTRGHRFHHPGLIPLDAAGDYAERLRGQGRVEAAFAARRERISDQVQALAEQTGGQARMDDALLDEVTSLCEWPVAFLGGFDPSFLEVPAEALVETMQKNQKYFPLLSADGSLLPYFIGVANIESQDPDVIRAGNERVIRPRFADAKFFWEQDLKTPLGDLAPRLDGVIFQHKLGSIGAKMARVADLGAAIADQLGVSAELVRRAAGLAKCDLVTLMVGEFASLQGIMGRYYAERSGEDHCVVAAIEEQYLPRHAGDRLPESPCGQILALADRLDTLVGIFAIGQRPSGVKDPYGLRRAAIGVLRILIETPLPLDLKALLQQAADAYPAEISADKVVDEVVGYCLERLDRYYGDQGISADTVEAVLGVAPTSPSDIDRRIRAVDTFRGLPEAASLAAANKRLRNILKKLPEADRAEVALDSARLTDPAEQRLADRIGTLSAEVEPLIEAGDYEATLRALSALRDDVDAFFDDVMVMVDDDALRHNRIALLRALEGPFLRVADISRLQPGREDGT